jgi:predicted transcriptional regulator
VNPPAKVDLEPHAERHLERPPDRRQQSHHHCGPGCQRSSLLTARVLDKIHNMRTIAITIEEDVLERVDRLAGRGNRAGRNRSHVIRQAVREYVSRLEHVAEAQREAAILRRHRSSLAQQARALVRQQAKP